MDTEQQNQMLKKIMKEHEKYYKKLTPTPREMYAWKHTNLLNTFPNKSR